MPTGTSISAVEVRDRLQLLLVERELAALDGLGGNALYMSDLEHDIAATRGAYVGVAVTEIATLRGELAGRLQG